MKLKMELLYGLYIDVEFVRQNKKIKVLKTSIEGIDVQLDQDGNEMLIEDILDQLGNSFQIIELQA